MKERKKENNCEQEGHRKTHVGVGDVLVKHFGVTITLM